MKKVAIYLLFCAALMIGFSCSQGKETGLAGSARIISLSPHITEIIYALGQENKLLAVTDYCRYPEPAQQKEKIGGLIDPNIEKIVSLQPTLLLGVPAHEKLNSELEKFDLRITMLENERITDVYRTIDSIGTLLQCEEKADSLSKGIRDSLMHLESTRPDKQPAALLVIGRERGTLRNITAAGTGTFMNEVWEIAGGKNIFPDLPSRYATINIESILKSDPDVIIEFDVLAPEGIINNPASTAWIELPRLSAVRNKQVFIIGGNYSLIPGPRLINLAHDFRKIISRIDTDQN